MSDLYYFGHANGYNQTYKTFNDFKKTVMPEKSVNKPEKELSVDEIMEKVKNTLDLFKQ